jgi:hypothetical protein
MKFTEAIEQLCNMRAMYRPEMAIYHSQAVLDLLRKGNEADHMIGSGRMHLSFGGENDDIRAVKYTGHEGMESFKISSQGK